MQGDFDFIIVGAGTAGCVLAARLAASGSHRVLLLEAGGEDSSPWIRVPVGYLFEKFAPRLEKKGFGKKELKKVLVDNPSRILAF